MTGLVWQRSWRQSRLLFFPEYPSSLSGRREEKRWKRKVLQETMVSLFDASFGSIDQATFEARQAGKDLDWYKERALDGHAAELQALTRLRFLAKPNVVKRAFELHHLEDELYSTVFNNPLDSAKWNELQEERRVARSRLFSACRRNLGLRRTVPHCQTPSWNGPGFKGGHPVRAVWPLCFFA